MIPLDRIHFAVQSTLQRQLEATMPDDTATLEELRTIRLMIAATRRSTVRHWIPLLIWGVLGIAASLASHLLLVTSHENAIGIVWMVYTVVAGLASSVFGRREDRRTQMRTFAGRAVGATWSAIGVTIVLLFVGAAALDALPFGYLPGVIVLVLTPGLFVMGALLEFKPLRAAAVLWWAGGFVMLLRPRDAFAVQTVLLVLGYLVPAELLRRQLATDDALD
jgi:hypothetical protein